MTYGPEARHFRAQVPAAAWTTLPAETANDDQPADDLKVVDPAKTNSLWQTVRRMASSLFVRMT